MPWTATHIQINENHTALHVNNFTGLEYLGHDIDDVDDDFTEVDYRTCYHEGAGDIGAGIVGYFEDDLCSLIRHALNYFTPPCREGWRWQSYEMGWDDPVYQEQFTDMLRKGCTGIYDENNELRGYVVAPVQSPAVFVILAVLNAGVRVPGI